MDKKVIGVICNPKNEEGFADLKNMLAPTPTWAGVELVKIQYLHQLRGLTLVGLMEMSDAKDHPGYAELLNHAHAQVRYRPEFKVSGVYPAGGIMEVEGGEFVVTKRGPRLSHLPLESPAEKAGRDLEQYLKEIYPGVNVDMPTDFKMPNNEADYSYQLDVYKAIAQNQDHATDVVDSFLKGLKTNTVNVDKYPRPDTCTKPDCNCLDYAEASNGGQPVKGYECRAKSNAYEAERVTGPGTAGRARFLDSWVQARTADLKRPSEIGQDTTTWGYMPIEYRVVNGLISGGPGPLLACQTCFKAGVLKPAVKDVSGNKGLYLCADCVDANTENYINRYE